MPEPREGLIPKITQAVKDRFTGPQEKLQKEPLNRLQNMAQQLDTLWSSQPIALKEDHAEWERRGHQGKYKVLSLPPPNDKSSSEAKFSSWIEPTRPNYMSQLNRVNGRIGRASYYIDLRQPYVGPNQNLRMAEVEIHDSLVPDNLKDHNIDQIKVCSEGLITNVNMDDERLRFDGGTHAWASYTAGTETIDKFTKKPVVISPQGPIHEVKMLVTSPDAEQTTEQQLWVGSHLSNKGKWEVTPVTDEWGRKIKLQAETLTDGGVKATLIVDGKTKEINLPKVDLDTILNTAGWLTGIIVRASKSQSFK